ncbi:MAG: hypothetical protein HYR85_07400 [Planctomycetes bacterium]|nr:hypothetical protein [Planctomycetota bacterium]MBI3844039.1 hypothetical protein [Planctomycetota bacterium]
MTLISGKQAAKSAIAYFRELMDSTTGKVEVEEIELSEGQKHWTVTLSWDQGLLLPIKYKVFKVNSETGAVTSMRMRRG